MLDNLEYSSWQLVPDVQVTLTVGDHFAVVVLPWAAAANKEDLVAVSMVVATINIHKYREKFQPNYTTLREKEEALDYGEGPMIELACPGCRESWSMWLDESGNPEDPRDQFCTTPTCPRRGHLGFPVK